LYLVVVIQKHLYSLHKISVIIIFFSVQLPAICGIPYRFPGGASELGKGSLCLTYSTLWSSFQNPALMSAHREFTAGLGCKNRFGIRELGYRSAAVIIASGSVPLGLICNHSGFPEYRRIAAAIAAGMKLSGNISGGIRIDYCSESTTGEYRNEHTVSFEAGMLIAINNKCSLGISLFNPVPAQLRERPLGSVLRTGVGVRQTDQLWYGAELELSTDRPAEFMSGAEYRFRDTFLLRSGYRTGNSSFSFGAGYIIKNIKVDLGFATHRQLGVTSSISIIYVNHRDR
jgi:hypothetical protein